MFNLRKLRKAFRYAFAGAGHALETQQNFKIYFLAAVLVVGAGLYFGITFLEWIALVFSIFLVLITEMINTAFEEMINLLKCEYDRRCRLAKDVAAGMVLFASVSAIIVGLLIFLPKILR